MADVRLNCYMSSDYLTAQTDSDGDVRIDVYPADASQIYARPDVAAEFARGILRLVGEAVDTSGDPVMRGDYVEVTKYRTRDRRYVGKRGRLTDIDTDDIPYRVEFDDGDTAWAMEVRKVNATTPADRPAALVEQAKSLLAGTSPTAADIVAMVRVLTDAGE
ncbi:hypothetical protein [Streptomyces sp. NPDC002491]